ncbi:MAG: hypothetical protein L0226_05900 [Acidobacteria bacterium]|nr:hypothetical protein [Acidobacteriota bacterium]
MKKISLMIALAMIAGTIAFSPITANAQEQDDKQVAFERDWYDACYVKKDTEKCYQLSKEMVEKNPSKNQQYMDAAKRTIKNTELNKAWERFNAALNAFYKNPPQDAAKLESVFAAGDDFLKVDSDPQSPFHLFVLGQMAIAGRIGVLGEIYKNLDRVKGYAERAIKAFESPVAPEKYKKEYSEYVLPLRDLVVANMNQYLGYYLIQTNGDQAQAIAYLTKATQVKGKDGTGWKDPNNYNLRASIYSKQYESLRKKYDALPDDQKTADAGKEILKQVNELLDTKLIPDYARVIATATTPESKEMKTGATELFNSFWKFRVDDPTKAPAFLKAFEADPTVEGPAVPAKAETTDLNAPAAPVGSSTGAKMTTGTTSTPPGTGSAKNSSNGSKSSSKPTSTKSKPKNTRRKPR